MQGPCQELWVLPWDAVKKLKCFLSMLPAQVAAAFQAQMAGRGAPPAMLPPRPMAPPPQLLPGMPPPGARPPMGMPPPGFPGALVCCRVCL